MVAQSGYITGTATVSSGSTAISVRVYWIETSFVSPNSSVVTAYYQMKRNAPNYSGSSTFFLTINGTKVTDTNGYTYPDDNAWHTIMSSAVTVAHNTNGSKSITISAGGVNSGTTWLTSSVSGTAVLEDYVRLPSAPSLVSLTRSVDGTAVTASYSGSTFYGTGGAYRYYWSYDASSWNGPVSSGVSATVAATSLVYVRGEAFDTEGSSATSTNSSYIGAPATRTDFRTGYLNTTVTPTTSSTIALDWSGSTTDVERYRVSYKRAIDSVWTDSGYSGLTSAYEVTGLSQNTIYDFRVSAENTTNNLVSGYATLSSATVPSTPTTLSVTSFTSSEVALNWYDNPVGFTSYKVEYKIAADSVWTNTGYLGTTSAYTVTGLAFNTEYDFRVSVLNSSNSTQSGFATVTQATLPAGPPVRTDAVTWSPSEVYVCTNSGTPTWTLGAMYVWNGTDWKVVG